MGELLMRRREMILPGGEEPIECPYITDGLIFWLDGIERGGVTGQWKDLIGGKIFTLYGVTEETDGVTFAGTTSSYGIYNGAVSSDWKIETIEATRATSEGTNACIFCPAGASSPIGIGLIFASAKDNCCIQIDGSTYSKFLTYSGWKRLSLNKDHGIRNGSVSVSKSGTDSWGKNTSGNTYLGVRYTSSLAKPFSGKLNSIRIYNRWLTEDEMKANQAVDATRFNV